MTTLRMRSPAQFTVSFFRPNLLFRVIQASCCAVAAAALCVCAPEWQAACHRAPHREQAEKACSAVLNADASALQACAQKDYTRHEESGLEGYLHDMLTDIQ